MTRGENIDPENCEHKLIIHVGIQEGAGERPPYKTGFCSNCTTEVTIGKGYKKLNLFWDFWGNKNQIYSKR